MSATDPKSGALTYSIASDASGTFEVVGTELRVKATGLDCETKTSHEVGSPSPTKTATRRPSP